jgi:hypothetical protein
LELEEEEGGSEVKQRRKMKEVLKEGFIIFRVLTFDFDSLRYNRGRYFALVHLNYGPRLLFDLDC